MSCFIKCCHVVFMALKTFSRIIHIGCICKFRINACPVNLLCFSISYVKKQYGGYKKCHPYTEIQSIFHNMLLILKNGDRYHLSQLFGIYPGKIEMCIKWYLSLSYLTFSALMSLSAPRPIVTGRFT